MISEAPQTLREFFVAQPTDTKPATVRDRLMTLKRFERYLGHEPMVADLSRDALVQFRAWMIAEGYANGTATISICGIRGIWRTAFSDGLTTAGPPAPHTSQSPHERRARKKLPHNPTAKVKLPDGPPPTLTSDSPLIDVCSHFTYCRLVGKHKKSSEHYRLAVRRFKDALNRVPTVADLTDANLELMVEQLQSQNYSHYTVVNTRWMLRALRNHLHQEGIKDDLPEGPRRPVNAPPAPLVEDISSAVAIHRAALEREAVRARRQRDANGDGKPLASVGRMFKRLLGSSPPRPPAPPAAPPAADRDPNTLTIAELVAAWRNEGTKHYPKEERVNVDCALRPLETFYGHELVVDFGPKKLKAVREMMVDGYNANGKFYPGLCRKGANARIQRIRRVFKWATSEELAPAGLAHSLASVTGLKWGRTTAPERDRILPVDAAIVDATLPHLSPVVATMVQVQLLAGMRPGEVCRMRPCDIDRLADVWVYKPPKHKTQHHGRERVIQLGPKAQVLLLPYLERDPTAYCFSPRESTLWRRAKQRMERKTPVQPSQLDRSVAVTSKRPGLVYTTNTYSKAILKACRAHGVEHWHPNQLRHTAATKIREQFGLEAAQVLLGHSRADVTQVYAERNTGLATEVIRKIG